MRDAEFKKCNVTIFYGDGKEHTHDALMIKNKDNEWFLFHYLNCLVRKFADDFYNHVEVYDDDQKECIGMRMSDEELYDYLIASGYPHRYDPVVDKNTENWALEVEQDLGITAIEDFLREQND